MKTAYTINRILLGLVMLGAGFAKLFITGAAGVSGLLSGIMLFAWAPLFWAGVLITFEILSGIAILANWKLEYSTIPPIVILLVASFFVHLNWMNLAQTNISTLLIHLAVVSNYFVLWSKANLNKHKR
ncbi:DoxX family protein [Candidatus Pacearchaeota archaeon]|nr:DoxX family protein [Candidatus Pacearchaeota archaeon]